MSTFTIFRRSLSERLRTTDSGFGGRQPDGDAKHTRGDLRATPGPRERRRTSQRGGPAGLETQRQEDQGARGNSAVGGGPRARHGRGRYPGERADHIRRIPVMGGVPPKNVFSWLCPKKHRRRQLQVYLDVSAFGRDQSYGLRIRFYQQ